MEELGSEEESGSDPIFFRVKRTSASGIQRETHLKRLRRHINDGILILDELGTCSVQDIGKIVYDLFGGQGKARMGKDASLLYRRSL